MSAPLSPPRKLLMAAGLLFIFVARNTAQDREAYIRQYQDIAVAEMHRTGIPASIKLAQGILESNCGQSDLAAQANNHFGIKCGGGWSGDSFHKEDDDYRDGELVPSCFRSFESALACYVAHSEFLTDPRKSHRYGPLFSLDPRDYKSWAHGLSKAGYATDPQYASRLIRIIEQYELYRYDAMQPSDLVAQQVAPATQPPPPAQGRRLLREVNGANYMTTLEGDRLSDIASLGNKKTADLIRYNDGLYAGTQALSAGTRIFLEPKKSAYKGSAKVHKLQPGETMADVAQKYGVKLSALQKRNGLKSGQHPAAGQKVYLKGKPAQPLRHADPYQAPDDPPAQSTPASNPQPVADSSTPARPAHGPAAGAAIPTPVPTSQAAGGVHQVNQGETLYGIARTYGVSVDELKKRNNLSADTIVVGQKLLVR